MTRAVFLDRDGVLNKTQLIAGKPHPPDHAGEVEIPSDAASALASLKEAGFLLIVVTNQPDVARGRQTRAGVEAIHQMLRSALPLDDFLVCYHDDADACNCRKPLPGLLETAAGRYGIKLGRSYLIGDRWRDIDAGSAAGCTTILIDYGYLERAPREAPDARVRSLGEAARWILSREETAASDRASEGVSEP